MLSSSAGIVRFTELRDEIRRERIGDGGWDTCAALTAALDAAIVELAGSIDQSAAVVAVGGYGRGEMCLFSDVDVMLLHRGAPLKPLTEALLYPLWDANLKVGHSVRTTKEAVAIAAEDFDTLTSLLTMRCLAGDASLVDELEKDLRQLLRKPFGPLLVEFERERRDLDPYPVMAADLKEGRGGLRTYQATVWEQRRTALLEGTADEGLGGQRHHYGRLLAVRNALHAAAGRALDRFHVELRAPAGRWLGADPFELASMVTTALHHGDRLAERAHPELVSDGDAQAAGTRRTSWLGRRRRPPTQPDRHDSPASPLRLAMRLAAQVEAAWLGSDAEAELRRAAWKKTTWSAEDRTALVELLTSGALGRAAWALLDEMGWMANHFPEWKVVATRPQLAPFHDHPVGTHLWRTVDEMLSVAGDAVDDLSGIADEVGSKRLLVLAAFFHDIGKGHGGDHSEIGAGIASSVLTRFGFSRDVVDTVAAVTRHHLLLAETSARRDLDDPRVISELAATVGDIQTLHVLYLLSIADARATGSGMLTEWKTQLLRAAFSRVGAALGASTPTVDERIDEAVAVAAPRHDRTAVETHVEAMDPSYLLSNEPADIAWHLDALASRSARDPAPAVMARDTKHGSRVVVAATDRTGLLGSIATVFAVHGISILAARLFTRADGIAVDVFDVEDDRTHTAVPVDRWDRVRRDLAGGQDMSSDLEEALAVRAKAYGDEGALTGVDVRAPNVPTSRHTLIEVRCGDRIGRLAQIVAALYAEELDISLAKLDTQAGRVVDTFYVTRGGRRLDSAEELFATVNAIKRRLRS